ncbi:GIY-YIG nuclease family protein [Actinoplanes sp. TRM 88003]|uniref:Excinuclease cho n=1 Tax=Paractinoplanes aksuensis TaxID=2939490 RepID=A0ABT1DYC6_9ACTN|nr:GIY-YIG nuclease family protein [Actinoplanes aksuensis]MCO8275854.1 GIY-YIG nuclease family protein [Actinoplanes aksuensis]
MKSLPAGPGVYRFRDGNGRVLYVGRATHLRSRVGSYWGDLRDRRHLRRMVPQIARVEAVACDSVHEAAWLERNLLERSKPRWNRIRGGLEVPFCIRVTTSKVELVHWRPGVEADFGPYLGGAQARLAVSGLDRMLPLRYTDERLEGGLRDLARIRGVRPQDRDAMRETLTAVLRREAGALSTVREGLSLLRDKASGNLAFELAGRIQQELEAVEWIVAEQKVTLLAPGADLDIYGYADGVLVRFQVRGGRLDRWEQRACAPAASRRYLDRTPPEWLPFAARNAELARSLS